MAKARSITSKIRSAFRDIWRMSEGPRAVKKRVQHPEKKHLFHCERCAEYREKIYIDHIIPVVVPEEGFKDWQRFYENLFVAAEKLQSLCYDCHKEKTKAEASVRKLFNRLNKGKL